MIAYKKLIPFFDGDKLIGFQSPAQGNVWLADEEGYPCLHAHSMKDNAGIHVVFSPNDQRLDDYKGVVCAVECWGKIIEYVNDDAPSSARVEYARVIEVVGQGGSMFATRRRDVAGDSV
jgi:hypothetical protein